MIQVIQIIQVMQVIQIIQFKKMKRKIKNKFKLLIVLFAIFNIYSSGQVKEDFLKEEYGTIQGYVSVLWPRCDEEETPKVKVCAISVNDSSIKYCTGEILCEEREKYSLKVPPGIYYVYSTYVDPHIQDKPSDRSYYTDMVLCGLDGDCYTASGERSVLLKVKVCANKIVENVNPEDMFWQEILIIQRDTIISIKRTPY